MSFQWNGSSASTVTGTVFTTCTGNLKFTDDDVRAVYIDWDDGMDTEGNSSNKKEYANYQWEQITKPTGTLNVKHTYTGTGTYAPVIQVVNSKGIVSKYYGSDSTNTDVSPYVDNPSHNVFKAIDGQATGVMRVENKQVLSGIDNSIFHVEGPKDIYVCVAPLLTQTQLHDWIDVIKLEVEAVVIRSAISTTDVTVQAGGTRSIETLTLSHTIAAGDQQVAIPITGGKVAEIKKVTFMNPKYSGSARDDDYQYNNAYNYLKIFITTRANDGLYYPVTYVTAGSPIKRADDPRRYITMDFSQSRAKASNVSNAFYRYDLGKLWLNPVYQWNAITGSTSGVYDFFGNNTSGTSSTKQVSYAYGGCRPDGLDGQTYIGAANTGTSMAFCDSGTQTGSPRGQWDGDYTGSGDYNLRTNQFLINEYGMFQDQYHLVRTSMQPTQAVVSNTGSEISSLIANKPHVMRITPPSDQLWWKIDDDPASATADYTQQAFQNASGNRVLLSGMNTMDFEYFNGDNRPNHNASEYLLMLWPKKTNKVFFNISNYADSLISGYMGLGRSPQNIGWKIAGVDYLVMENTGTRKIQNAYWQAVPFEDTTATTITMRQPTEKEYIPVTCGLSKSGYVGFDMPLDWAKTSFTNLCGGVFNPSSVPTTPTAGEFDITITGTVATGSADSTYGKSITLSSITATAGNELSTLGTADDIGAFKYLAFVKTAAGGTNIINSPLWVAGANGTNAANAGLTTLTMIYGENDASDYNVDSLDGDSGVVFVIRRINAYDVVDGATKVQKGSSAILTPPVDYAFGRSFPHTYMLSGTASTLTSFGTAFSAAWKTGEYYPLRITLSGAVNSNDGGHRFPEIFNVFDATESHVDIVKEVDDSAFNLNGIPITSDISITRGGTFYSAITKKGQVYINRTGDAIQSISFSSVALGDNNSSTAFADIWDETVSYPNGNICDNKGTLYWNLHQLRDLQARSLRVYWDEKQKDETFVRYFGVVTSLAESNQQGGPNAPVRFTFTMMVSEIALISGDYLLMTDLFPLGGIISDRDYTSGGTTTFT